MRFAKAALVMLLTAGCQSSASVLDPAGSRAAGAAFLHWVMFGLGAAVFVIVLALLGYALVTRPGSRAGAREDASRDGLWLVIAGGVGLPIVVLPILWVLTIADMQRQAQPPRPPEITVDLVGRQWAYEATCPGVEGTLTNEIRIPAGEPVRIRMTSEDVIHSFWVPQLAGKQDMIPGETTELWLEADEPGVYIAECAEYCGLHHADMRLRVVVEDPGACGATGAACCG